MYVRTHQENLKIVRFPGRVRVIVSNGHKTAQNKLEEMISACVERCFLHPLDVCPPIKPKKHQNRPATVHVTAVHEGTSVSM